ncbi:hypothetical protein Aglo03_13380 [Actinokineospora globicatena]|uniref:Uncharacterized protein n=1 Tax=Actinokineospora globicatena TaxID=103729 RepID=A0A9W6QJA2_9PSEU|nr:hypothetical protein Aglo03_13380 [Actinokineospora globicatena]
MNATIAMAIVPNSTGWSSHPSTTNPPGCRRPSTTAATSTAATPSGIIHNRLRTDVSFMVPGCYDSPPAPPVTSTGVSTGHPPAGYQRVPLRARPRAVSAAVAAGQRQDHPLAAGLVDSVVRVNA